MYYTQFAGKAMLSQPMAGKTDEEIIVTREKAISVLRDKGYEVVNTLFTDEWDSKESGEHELVPCSILLQRLGERQRLQDRA